MNGLVVGSRTRSREVAVVVCRMCSMVAEASVLDEPRPCARGGRFARHQRLLPGVLLSSTLVSLVSFLELDEGMLLPACK